MKNKIIPCIWFNFDNGQMSQIISYYKNIFYKNFEAQPVVQLGDTPGGYTEMCEVKIFDKRYSLLNTSEEHHPLNDSISFIIHCDNQEEIDLYWNYFTKEGKESQCGWCIDKLGLRWQIIPSNLNELMSLPNANEVMMNQKKIIISEY